MPRPLRIQYEGAWYHVMNRGIDRQAIFKNDKHRTTFLTLLGEAVKKYQVEIHAYCLMGNHYHILMRTPLANLSRCMQYLDGVYTQRFNLLTKRDGALFRGRYKAILVEADAYLLQVSRYIHLNPVEAGLCQYPQDYTWSSFRAYMSPNGIDSWLETDFILEQMGAVSPHQKYSEYVLMGNNVQINEFYGQKQTPSIYGNEKFIADNLKKLDDNYIAGVKTDFNRTKPLPDPDEVIVSVVKYLQVPKDTINESCRGKRNLARMMSVYMLNDLTQLTYKQIATYFKGLAYQSVGTVIARFEAMLKSNSSARERVEALRNSIMYKHD